MVDGNSVRARDIVVTPTTTSWVVPKAAPWSEVSTGQAPTAEVAQIVLPRRGSGALRGLGVGALVGALVGLGTGAGSGLGSTAAGVGAPVGGLIGALVGFSRGVDRYPVVIAVGSQ
jgi:hypothetical protein